MSGHGMVALLKEFYGRGLRQAKSYYEDDLVVCHGRWRAGVGDGPNLWLLGSSCQ